MEQGPLTFEAYLAQYAPGPDLAAALGAIDPEELSGYDAVWYLRAEYRQAAHQDWRVRRAVATVSRRGVDEERRSEPDEWSSLEVKAALGLTRYHANKLVAQAWDITDRCPEIGAAMADGELDWPRAEKLLEATAGQTEAVTASVVASMLPRASLSAPKPETTGQIAEAAEELAIALDPSYAKSKYDSAVRRRNVICRRNPDGTADLTGTQLPPERAKASSNRLDRMAKSAKNDGDPRPIGHLRTEIALCLTEGTWDGLTEAEMLAALKATRPQPGDEPTDNKPTKPLDGIELRLRLSTALGGDRKPGELAGHGPVHAEHALTILAGLAAAQWRWVLVDPKGRLLRTGLTRARPHGWDKRNGACDSVVDLHIHEDYLAELLLRATERGQLPPWHVEQAIWNLWRPVILDIARKAGADARPPDDPERRFVGAELRREIQTALTRCIGVGCRVPASRTDMDHTLDHAKGGKSTAENNGPACRYDHTAKHKGGWKLERVERGYRWTSRLRHIYEVPDPPVSRNLPDPLPDSPGHDDNAPPGTEGATDTLGRPWHASGIWEYDGDCRPPPF